MDEGNVTALGSRFANLEPGWSATLRDVTPEQAATAMCEHFRRTGCAQAEVSEPAEVRRLSSRDCRRRGIRIKTLAVGDVVVIYDDERRNAFAATPEGKRASDVTLEAITRFRARHPSNR